MNAKSWPELFQFIMVSQMATLTKQINKINVSGFVRQSIIKLYDISFRVVSVPTTVLFHAYQVQKLEMRNNNQIRLVQRNLTLITANIWSHSKRLYHLRLYFSSYFT